MTQFLGALLLTGVLGYIPYKYLTMIGLVSEKNKIINTPVLLIFSIETCLIWFYTFIIFNNVDLKNLSLLQLLTGLKANIWFLIIFVLTVLVFNPLIVKFIIWLINETRKFMNLDCISLLDKRDKLFNNNGKPVFIVIKDFENRIIEEGELKTYNSAGSDFDLLEVERQDFKVSDLPSNDELYIKHTLVDLKQQIKLDLYLMNINLFFLAFSDKVLFKFSLAPGFSKLLFIGLLRVASCFLFLSAIKFSPPFNVYTSRRFFI